MRSVGSGVSPATHQVLFLGDPTDTSQAKLSPVLQQTWLQPFRCWLEIEKVLFSAGHGVSLTKVAFVSMGHLMQCG